MAEIKCPQDWSEWTEWLSAGLHGRCRWRLPILLMGILFARPRQTVASWLRAAGVGLGFSEYYYFIGALGRKSKLIGGILLNLLLNRLASGDRVLFALDDTPTKRYGPKVEGAGIHHNPTPGPADAAYLYGHIWVTLALIAHHPLWGTIGLPVLAALYVRQIDVPNLNLWMYCLVELWAGTNRKPKSALRSASPWDDPDRRPSHADRRKALCRNIFQFELSTLSLAGPIKRKIANLFARSLNASL